MEDTPSHFKGKDAIGHVAEARAQGIVSSIEIHGTEGTGQVVAAADTLRDCSFFLLLAWTFMVMANFSALAQIVFLGILGIAFAIWKTTRSAWLGWSRLERLHRVLEEEKWEIEHHRQQEREELGALYAAKGFEGKLLEDVLDVLMADGDRLLKVMVEEELGLTLERNEHPLMEGLGALYGSLIALLAVILGLLIHSTYGVFTAAAIAIAAGAALSAKTAKNQVLPAVVWNLGFLALAYGSFYFLIQWVTKVAD